MNILVVRFLIKNRFDFRLKLDEIESHTYRIFFKTIFLIKFNIRWTAVENDFITIETFSHIDTFID
jgi:hypothetical protein